MLVPSSCRVDGCAPVKPYRHDQRVARDPRPVVGLTISHFGCGIRRPVRPPGLAVAGRHGAVAQGAEADAVDTHSTNTPLPSFFSACARSYSLMSRLTMPAAVTR